MGWVKIAGAQNGARAVAAGQDDAIEVWLVLTWGDLNSASIHVASKVGAVKYYARLSWLPEGFAPG